MTKIFGYIFILISLLVAVSCSVEKINLSPVNDLPSGNNPDSFSYNQGKEIIVYSSEITNLTATFPKFKNDAVNAEVANLKYQLKDYIGALEAYNINGMTHAQRRFEKSYKKLQNLRKYLNSDDDQVLNRYLVRIKTNMSLLENYLPKDTAFPNTKN